MLLPVLSSKGKGASERFVVACLPDVYCSCSGVGYPHCAIVWFVWFVVCSPSFFSVDPVFVFVSIMMVPILSSSPKNASSVTSARSGGNVQLSRAHPPRRTQITGRRGILRRRRFCCCCYYCCFEVSIQRVNTISRRHGQPRLAVARRRGAGLRKPRE